MVVSLAWRGFGKTGFYASQFVYVYLVFAKIPRFRRQPFSGIPMKRAVDPFSQTCSRPVIVPDDEGSIECDSGLSERTLVLNRSWMAVNVTSVRRALTLAYLGCARIVEPNTFDTYDFEQWMMLRATTKDRAIRTVTSSIRVPELIVLQTFDQQPVLRVPFSRRNLFLRDNYRCQYCSIRASSSELSIDHVLPRSRGGASSWSNCVLACYSCNVRKGNRTPMEAGMRLLRQPSQPRWPIYVALGLNRKMESWQRFVTDSTATEAAG